MPECVRRGRTELPAQEVYGRLQTSSKPGSRQRYWISPDVTIPSALVLGVRGGFKISFDKSSPLQLPVCRARVEWTLSDRSLRTPLEGTIKALGKTQLVAGVRANL